MTTNLKRVFSAPDSEFRNPQRVLEEPALSFDEKAAVLRNWKLELLRKLNGGHEQDRNAGPGSIATRLQAVIEAIADLRRMAPA
jgi:hypothetical protein